MKALLSPVFISFTRRNMDTHTLYSQFSDDEFARRSAAVRAAIKEADLPVLLMYGSPPFTNAEIHYLCNYPITWEAFLIFPAEALPQATLFAQMRNHLQQATLLTRHADVHWGGLNTAAAAAEKLKEQGFAERRIGLVGFNFPLHHFELLSHELPKATWVDFTRQMLEIRLVKSEEELAALRQGAEFCDLAIEALEREARPGMTKHQLAAIVQGSYLGLGGRNTIHYLATTPMSNPSDCAPRQYQSARVLEKGDVLLTELSAHRFEGYPGQILRPFTIGNTPPTAAYQKMYEVAVETFHRLASVIRAGTTTEEVLDAAEYIHESGYTIYDDLVHCLGGGYLPPILRTRRTSPSPPPLYTYRENMTIVIQPNIVTEDERMGVQVGELLRVTKDGVESFHRYPMRFIQCVS
jgi:Xaa-Pro dipeptidase